MLIVKGVFSLRVSPFLGLVNFDDGMFSVEGMAPMGAGLHDPLVTCFPSVIVCPTQKLMKLLVDVKDATCPRFQDERGNVSTGKTTNRQLVHLV